MAKLKVYLTAETKKFRRGLMKADRSVRRLSKNMKRYGAIAGAAFAAGAAASIRAYAEQEKAESKLRGTLQATAGAVGLSFREITKEAARLQGVTKFGDEAIIQGQAILTTFRNLKGPVFKDTTKLMLDLSETLGTDVKSSAIQLGKALNDPVTGLTALTRSGITFNEAQKKQIKDLVKSNRLFDAQQVMLKELKMQFGGVAQEMAKTPTGKLVQIKNALGDVSEGIGKVFIETGQMVFGFDNAATTFSQFASDLKSRSNEIAFALAYAWIEVRTAFMRTFTVARVIIQNFWHVVKTVAGNIWEALKSAFHNIKADLKNTWIVGKAVWAGMSQGMVKAFTLAFRSVGNTASKVWDAIKAGEFGNIGDIISADSGRFKAGLKQIIGEAGTDMFKNMKGLEKKTQAVYKEVIDPRKIKSISGELAKVEKKRIEDQAKLEEKLRKGVAKRVAQETKDRAKVKQETAEKKAVASKGKRPTDVFTDSLLRVGGVLGGTGATRQTEEAKELKKQTPLMVKIASEIGTAMIPRFV